MPRKRFEETPYNPIAADLALEVSAAGRGGAPSPLRPAPVTQPNIVELRKEAMGSPVSKLKENPRHELPKARALEPTITKRFVVTRSEDDDLTAFLLRLQKRAGTKVTLSVIARAALNVAMQAEDHIVAEIGERFPMELPSTHDSIAQAEYEDRWTKALMNAFRRMPRVGR